MTKLKYIIETITSERDHYGNCYHFAHVKRLSDDATFTTTVGGPSNAQGKARQAGLEFEELYNIEKVVPKREYKWLSRDVKYREPELLEFFGGCKHNGRKYAGRCEACGTLMEVKEGGYHEKRTEN